VLTEDAKNFLLVIHRGISADQAFHRLVCSFDGFWDLINILGLYDSLEIIFENLGEVVCEMSAYVRVQSSLTAITYSVAQNL